MEYVCKSSSVFPLGTAKLNSADAVCIPGRGRIGAGQKVQKLGFWSELAQKLPLESSVHWQAHLRPCWSCCGPLPPMCTSWAGTSH